MRTPSREQQNALCLPAARVRLIRAAPGSGKTWLVAEVILRELAAWRTKTSGIAALSFTRVGGQEIRNAVGHEIGHPHFVGTIDAFLFRYVLRPFLSRVHPGFPEPRLIPGDWGAENWRKYAKGQSTTVAKGINLFDCVILDEDALGGAKIAYKPHPAQPLKFLVGNDLSAVKEGKKVLWKHGLLSHSDCAFWASQVLNHSKFGPVVRSEIVRRFPFLIVDELQDTGHFLGKSIRLLLEETGVRALLVGDPDQAIFEFTGARPALFDTFNSVTGTASLTLATTRRCPPAIISAACHVKDTPGEVESAAASGGRAILVRYEDSAKDLPDILKQILNDGKLVTKIICRAGATVDQLNGRQTKDAENLHCPPVTNLHRAVLRFRQGKSLIAQSQCRSAVEIALFDHENVTEDELAASGIKIPEWKDLIITCLLRANEIPIDKTHLDWCIGAASVLDNEISKFVKGLALKYEVGNLKPKKRKGYDDKSAQLFPANLALEGMSPRYSAQTVHSVKGETHDRTVFVIPAVNPSKCPSIVWWSANEKDREEKRIAYVAMTRSQNELILCAQEPVYQRLLSSRPEFCGCFETFTKKEFLALGAPASPPIGKAVLASSL